MAQAKDESNKKQQLRSTPEEVFSGDKAKVDAWRQWIADEKAARSKAADKAKQLEADRREIDRYLAIRDNQTRPPWMEPQIVFRPGKKETLKQWLPGAIKRWPRDKVGVADYPEFLRRMSGYRWSRHSIENALSALNKKS
jgi:hypothetical protein